MLLSPDVVERNAPCCQRAYCKLSVNGAWQIVSVLLDPLVCVADTSLSSTSSADDGPLVMKTSSAIVCFESGHAALATVSMIALIGYTVVVLRLIRVQGNLESVEFSLRR